MGVPFGDLFKMLGQQGPDAWFVNATQLALTVARGDDGDPNPAPAQRSRVEELAPLVGRHVDALFGVVADYEVRAVNRSGLTTVALEQWRPLLDPLVNAASAPALPEGAPAMMAQFSASLGPMMLGMQLGSVAGHFSDRAWALSALPLPRTSAAHDLVVNNVVAFADEWTLDRDVVFTYALAREFVASTVLCQPGLGDSLRALLLDAVKEAAQTQGDILGRLQDLMGNPEGLASLMGNPQSLLDDMAAPAPSTVADAMNAATAALAAFFDAAALAITASMHGPQPALAEAWRRHRRSDAKGEDAAAALFSVSLQGPHVDEATTFVAALEAAHGLSVFDAFLRVDGLPTASELSAPAQWYERVTHSPLA
jgi:uncharacterized protein (DUF2342 family)